MPAHRIFPVEAIVLFPLFGPPVLALVGATLYAALLLIVSLSPEAILVLPVYFWFWAKPAYAALWPSAAAAGVLYALAVRLFAPPLAVTAIISGVLGALAYGIVFMLLGLSPLGTLPESAGAVRKVDVDSAVVLSVVGLVQVLPGWWASQKMRGWFGRRGEAYPQDVP
jgi:hypothetical protein